jgi:nitrate reductase NapE component
VKVPVPAFVPILSSVFESSMVGFDAVLQHTPLIVTVAPPSAVTLFSEQVAVVAVMPVIWPVVTVGFDVGGSGFSCGPQEYNIKPIVSSKKIFFIIDSLLFHRLYFTLIPQHFS